MRMQVSRPNGGCRPRMRGNKRCTVMPLLLIDGGIGEDYTLAVGCCTCTVISIIIVMVSRCTSHTVVAIIACNVIDIPSVVSGSRPVFKRMLLLCTSPHRRRRRHHHHGRGVGAEAERHPSGYRIDHHCTSGTSAPC